MCRFERKKLWQAMFPAARASAGAAVILATVLAATPPARADSTRREMERLRQQVQTLMNELHQIKAQQNAAVQASEARQKRELQAVEARQAALERAQQKVQTEVFAPGSKPGTWKIPGTDTSVKFGGYVKLDFIYNPDADVGDSFAASAIPMKGTVANSRKNSIRLNARQSRLNFQTWTPTRFGELHTDIEGDFYGAGGNQVFSNSTSFRLRHAYGELGPWLAGQTWSDFMDLDAYPTTVDFFGPAGIPFIRQPQVRYTYRPDKSWAYSVSVENPELSGRTIKAGQQVARLDPSLGGNGLDQLPDFVAAVAYHDSSGTEFKLAGVGRRLTVKGPGASDSTGAWGVHLGGVLPLARFAPGLAGTRLIGNVTGGVGVGRYIINGAGNGAIFNPVTNQLSAVTEIGATLAVSHDWSKRYQSNLVWGYYQSQTFLPGDTRRLNTVHANLLYHPVKNVTLGAEYIFGVRQTRGLGQNHASRIQFAAQYDF